MSEFNIRGDCLCLEMNFSTQHASHFKCYKAAQTVNITDGEGDYCVFKSFYLQMTSKTRCDVHHL